MTTDPNRTINTVLSDMRKEGMASQPDHRILDNLLIEALEFATSARSKSDSTWSEIVDAFRKIKGLPC